MARFVLIHGRDGRAIGEHEIRPVVRAFGCEVEVVRPRPTLAILLGRDHSWERPVPGERPAEFGTPESDAAEFGSALVVSSASAPPAVVPDAQSLLADGGVARQLLGPFVALAWSPSTTRIITDPLARRAVWSSDRPGQVVCGSEPHLVLAHPDVPTRPDMGVLAERLSYRNVSGLATVFEGLTLTGAGTQLDLDRVGRVSRRRWFEWDLTTDRDTPIEAWAARVLEATEEVVGREVRARGAARSALHLSGGLDSSALAGVIAHLGLDRDMTALARRYPGLPSDESAFQEAVLAGTDFTPRTTPPQPLDLDRDLGAPAAARRLPLLRIEPAERVDSGWARSAGRHSELTGVGGDELFARLHTAALEEVAVGRWRTAARTARRAGLRQLVHDHVEFAPDVIRRRRVRFRPWMAEPFATEVGLGERLLGERTPIGPSSRPSQRLRWAIGGGWQAIQAESTERHLATVGTEFVPLFLDPALVALALRIPDQIRSTSDDARHLQRLSFADRLPAALRTRRGKVHFDARHALDLGHPDVVAIGADLALARAGMIDQAAFDEARDRLRVALARDPSSIPALAGPLWAVIGCEMWWRSEGF